MNWLNAAADNVKQPKRTDIKLFCCFLNQIKLGVSSEEWLQPLKDSEASKRALRATAFLLGKKMTDSGFIYAIKAKKQPYVKIGLAGDPFQRIRNLQPGSPYKLQVAQTWEVHNMKAAEDAAHDAMEGYNRGRHDDSPYETEWFEMPEGGLEKVDEIVSGAISEHISGKTTKYAVE